VIKCARSFGGREYLSNGTKPIYVKY